MPKCAVKSCPRLKHEGDLCHSHNTIRRLGLPDAESVWIAKRLANYVVNENDCWIWQGTPNNVGYGKVGVRNDPSTPGEEEAAHRWFYKRLRGPIPEGLHLDHLCRTPLCVNPAHLEPVTQEENTRRGLASRGLGPGRTHCVNGHPWTQENVRRASTKTGEEHLMRCKACNTENVRRRNGHQPRRAVSA